MGYGEGPRDWSPKSVLVPPSYRCKKCGLSGVKLWRQYNTFADNIQLLCVDCAEVNQGKKCMLSAPDPNRTDAIGWLVPAVPTEDGETFWGYTSVPEEGCVWWDALPLRQGEAT